MSKTQFSGSTKSAESQLSCVIFCPTCVVVIMWSDIVFFQQSTQRSKERNTSPYTFVSVPFNAIHLCNYCVYFQHFMYALIISYLLRLRYCNWDEYFVCRFIFHISHTLCLKYVAQAALPV
jgi:hypothetical protein